MHDNRAEILRGAQEYAAVLEPSSRTSVRARVLALIDRQAFERAPLRTRIVGPEEVTREAVLRGAIHLHLDLMFRTSLSSEELLFTAAKGWVVIAIHPDLPRFPVGVALALPARRLTRVRSELFDEVPRPEDAASVVIYSIATNPPGLGAGAAMVKALAEVAGGLRGEPSLVAFSPLTGMRARVIRVLDDAEVWSRLAREQPEIDRQLLREQLLDLLDRGVRPDVIDEPARSWLSAEAHRFASSDSYRAGSFHRSMGAKLVGLAEAGDPTDGESMWMRAYHEYEV